MCSLKSKPRGRSSAPLDINPQTNISHINGRPVLQPAGNRVPLIERRNSLVNKKPSPKSPTNPPLSSSPNSNSSNTITNNAKVKPSAAPAPATVTTPPISPKLKSPRPPAVKRSGNNADPNGLYSSAEKVLITPKSTNKSAISRTVKKSKQCGSPAAGGGDLAIMPCLDISLLMAEAPPGSIAAARREQVAIMQVQRKMRIGHYGRTNSAKYQGKVVPLAMADSANGAVREEIKRCSFVTINSDPIYIAYHDEEWGVPVHDDKMLFELLVLTTAQVGSDWTSVLKKRQDFRDAFSGFDAEIVSAYSEKKIASIVADYGIELSHVRGAVDNANRILEIRRELGSFDKYLWSFVNYKPMETQYKSSYKIPVKSSKSDAMSKDLVRRGFRFVGPTVMHSFMQAAGLSNDHLVTCRRHQHCLALASSPN